MMMECFIASRRPSAHFARRIASCRFPEKHFSEEPPEVNIAAKAIRVHSPMTLMMTRFRRCPLNSA
jgi:hypothetical protein